MSTLNVRLLSAGYKLCKHRLAAAPPYINQQLRVVSIFFSISEQKSEYAFPEVSNCPFHIQQD